jgi:methionyl-tRNA synthetase
MWIDRPVGAGQEQATRKQLETVIYNLLEGLRIISGLIYPVMPDTAANMQKHLGFSGEDDFYKLDRLVTWRGVKRRVCN